MAQVEFVAAMWEILSTWKVEVQTIGKETEEEARKRTVELMVQSQPKVALQLRNPEEALLRFIRRRNMFAGS